MASSSRSDLVRMAAVLGALLLVTGGILLLTGGSGGEEPKQGSVDGKLSAVDETRVVLQPEGGGAPQTFGVRPVDARTLDLMHLQQHMSQGLPSRVVFETEGDTRYAVRVDDLPSP